MTASRWNVAIKSPMGDRSGVLALNIEGATVSGSLSDGEHHVAISDGRLNGNQLEWQAKISKPMRLSFKFTAVIEGDRITGTARHLLGTATFTGTRI